MPNINLNRKARPALPARGGLWCLLCSGKGEVFLSMPENAQE